MAYFFQNLFTFAQRFDYSVDNFGVGLSVDVENNFVALIQIAGDEGRRGQVLHRHDLNLGIAELNLRKVPEHKLLQTESKNTVTILWRTTLSGDQSSSGFIDPLLEASSLDSFRADLGESGKGI